MFRPPPRSTLFPSPTLFRSLWASFNPGVGNPRYRPVAWQFGAFTAAVAQRYGADVQEYILWNEPNLPLWLDRKSTRLNSSHPSISYAVFCLKKKKDTTDSI